MAQNELLEEKAQGLDYEPIIPKIRNWPIAKLYQNRQQFEDEVIERTLAKLFANSSADKLEAEIARAYYSETQRIKRQPWKADRPDEADFWNSIKQDTNDFEPSASNAEKKQKYQDVIKIIVRRYTEEISGNFKPEAYNFAKRFLSFGFASLLNAFQAKNIKAIWDHRVFIQDRIKLVGNIEKIRKLAQKGTVVLLPTHFSNLDSIMVGWSIHAMGLPAFIYGAGLNLYNSKLISYFMNNLGAYKVDRRKKNPFYLETLKVFSTVSLEHGTHSLFFPGGTRSRSGSIENNLKLGLLGSVFDAQRNLIVKAQEKGTEPEKIFIVPLTMSYHFVLEAKSLIRQYLKRSDKEKYYFNRKDEFSSQRKVISFIFELLKKKSDIYLSYGEPFDLFGNQLDDDGDSLYNGQKVDITKYFVTDGIIKKDAQRESVYTKELGDIVAKKYLEINVVLTSHLVSYVTYEMLLKKFKVNDVYSLFEFDDEDLFIERDKFLSELSKYQSVLIKLEKEGKLKLSPDMRLSPDEVMKDGIKNVGIFHNTKALSIKEDGDITSNDLELLFYYRNRMLGYDLEEKL